MNRIIHAPAAVFLLLLFSGCGPSGKGNPSAALPPEVRSFAARKADQAKDLAKRLNLEVAPDIWSYFAAARQGNWLQVSRLWDRLKKRAGQYEGSKADRTVTTPVWQTIIETQLACEQFALGEPEYARAFGLDIIKSIPPGSIYFGGTDPGRGLVTLLCTSQETGDPFFTVTQNALADGNYLAYLDAIYFGRIYTPTTEDSAKCFQEYLVDAQNRLQQHQLKPGEDVKIAGNRVQVRGQVAVMAINALLAKVIFDRNTNREFYIEESFPLDWMYPHLEPHGLIMAIRREPLSRLSAEVVDSDRKYWAERTGPMIGDWLKAETPVRDICACAEQVFLRGELAGFRGDRKFVTNTNTCGMYSKARTAIASVYAWREAHPTEAAEKERMSQAADFAFRQALALCPYSLEAVFRYVSFLREHNRHQDALRVGQTALALRPENPEIKELVRQLQRTAIR